MKIIVVYLGYPSGIVLFEEKDRAIANAYLKAFGRSGCYLETVVTTHNPTLEEIALECNCSLVLVQKWATEDTEVERQ